LKKDYKKKRVFAKKSLGQNFLCDQDYIEKIVNSLNLQPDDSVLEIGPGRGALTKKLIERARSVIAVELDTNLIGVLRQEYGDRANFRLIEADALEIDFHKVLPPSPVKIAANLPYNISTAILQKIIKKRECFSEAVLMLQREVVERITAPPGNRERGFLTVLIEAYCRTVKLFDVPPDAFRPVPKVWSSVVKIEFSDSSPITSVDEQLFFQIISSGFTQKRKTILNNIKNIFCNLSINNPNIKSAQEMLELSGVDANVRAEDLTLEDWINLVKVLG
jgi:16S rRNA (adenine1518-N6/adenine1519-N6)-dimethyltransferase